MELLEQKLRDCLHNLLIGENSPNNFVSTYGVFQYIKDHSKDIGNIVNIEVELHDIFEDEDFYHRRPFVPLFGFRNLEGSYEIKSVQTKKYSYEDFQKRNSTFITTNDLIKEKEIDNRLSFIDIRGELHLNIQEDKGINFGSSLIEIKEDLKLNIQRDIEIGKYDVYYSSDVIYNKTYKLELVIFKKKIWALPLEDVKLEYYKHYVHEEFEKLQYELEKYYEYPDQKRHLSVIDFYISKFSEETDKQPDENIKACYALFKRELRKLRTDVVSYYGHPYKASFDPEKLVWTGSFHEFIDFFEPLIDMGLINFKGRKDKHSIYANLLNNIYITTQPDVTVNYIMMVLKINVSIPFKEIEQCKLIWTRGRDEFAIEFKDTIYPQMYEKSQFLYHGKGSLRAIVKKFHEIFQIENKRHPGAYITEGSLIQSFKKIIFNTPSKLSSPIL